jgi:hypothetical protein
MKITVSFQERVLHHIFRVFAILRNVLRDPKYVPIVPPNQFLKGTDVTALSGLYERQLVGNWLIYFGLDGTHYSSDATIFTWRGTRNCYFTW